MGVLTNLSGSAGIAGVATALAYLGCVTALAITGHITGSEALVALGLLGGSATGVVATHVAGNAISNAASPPVPVPPAEKLV